MLQVIDLTFGYSEKPLYKGVNFVVGKGQKVGLVGPNGSGKSTLLSIIQGEENSFIGKVNVHGTVTLVPQEIKNNADMDASNTVRDYVDKNNHFQNFEIYKMFKGLELNINLSHNPRTLSGGQKTKLSLARALMLNPDILLLDEPTNFMDINGKTWVMKFLAEYQGTVIVVSHDLELMDQSLDKIFAVTPYNSTITEYKGTYSDYIRLKKENEEKLKREFEIKSRHLKRTEERYNTSRAVASKSIIRRKLERERLSLPQIPEELRKINVTLPIPKKVGELPIRAINIKKNYDELQILHDVNLTVVRNQKIVLIGTNGTGKSTFIKILMGLLDATSGEVFKHPDLSIGYYSQEFETFDFSKTVMDTFCDATKKDESFARSFLGRYMLSGNKVYQSVGSLSGGEKTRLSISILTGKDNNLLILDEPTTYLDVMSQRIILESLKEYKGTMIVVSHTPDFIKELKPDKAFLFPEEKSVFWDDDLLNRISEI